MKSPIEVNPIDFLMLKDGQLCKLILLFGELPFTTEKRDPFDALARAIIGQQLSTSAAQSIRNRIIDIHGKRPFKANKFLNIDPKLLRECGVSNAKIKALLGVAEGCIKKDLTLSSFNKLTDEEAVQKLTSYWGVGNWTAEMFLMFTLKRLDVLALGDVGLQRAHKILYPRSKGLEFTAKKWRPYRAVAAGYLWKFIDNPDCHEIILKTTAI